MLHIQLELRLDSSLPASLAPSSLSHSASLSTAFSQNVAHAACPWQAFSCTRFPNGRLYLSSAPQVECWTGHHWLMVALATIYIPAFVIGLPVAVLLVIRAKEKQAQLNRVSFHSVWGRLYSRYDPGTASSTNVLLFSTRCSNILCANACLGRWQDGSGGRRCCCCAGCCCP